MRGEKRLVLVHRKALTGSPPHARGKDDAAEQKSNLFGITPACAGKSSTLSVSMAVIRDHPRMRGEKVD